ncbi:MAG: prenyltransferase [Candidatus Omnitrophica bacterium]|jgi:1,4-dihydroxy-2-naphthoate octaprenyltransferase|nr:prenyltransferase [Candidatus Omnitrophota bacterium]
MFRNLVEAFRLPFVGASILPFIFGSVINRKNFNLSGFILGFFAVLSMHISANLINDYADSRSGVDWQDKNSYKFFGGSKFIQQNIFSERFYLKFAIFFAIVSAFSVLLLSLVLKTFLVVFIYGFVIVLSWVYSVSPLRLSYHKVGEIAIFILFGPVLVMGGYFIQTRIFPDLKAFLLSVPFGFFTTAILFANEVPDFPDDNKVGKNTLVSVIGVDKSFLFYYLLVGAGFLFILINILAGFLSPWASLAFILIIPAYSAAKIIKNYSDSKFRLIQSSRLTIVVQIFVSACLIIVTLIN